MLELSYLDLPYDLKPCFLYLGIFPEDSEIDVKDLIQLWIGEGLLRQDLCHEAQTLEELGMDVVNELVQRCMVQVVHRDYEEKVEMIQVHDLMRDLCMKKARESGFFDVASPAAVPSNTMDLKSRRVIILEDRKSYPMKSSGLRSVITFSKYGERRSIRLEMSYESIRLLRVLDIVNVNLRNIKLLIGNLILLRHLRIWSCVGVMNMVLESVKKLQKLLTFKFRSNDFKSVKVPDDMVGGMEHFRSLTLCDSCAKFGFPSVMGLGSSRTLQSLESTSGEWLCKDLQAVNLIHSLRSLTLRGIYTQTQLDTVYDFVEAPSNHFQDLSLSTYRGLEFDLKRMKLERCSQLKSLELCGRIRKQEGLVFFPPNLLDLQLQGSCIEKSEELERALAQLHQLRRLRLMLGSYDGDKLTMVGLPQLQHLGIWALHNLKEWRIEQGTMCQLKHLTLLECSKLERIPEGISDIRTLQYLKALGMSSSFCKRVEKPIEKEGKGGGEDFHLIHHNPNTLIYSR